MTITVLLADDEHLLRSALATLLPLEGEIAVIAQASDGEKACTIARDLRPDVVVLDQQMPGLTGIEAAERLLDEDAKRGVIMLTSHAAPGLLRSALKLGVRGFLSKSADPAELAMAIDIVAGGGRYLDSEVSAQALASDNPLTERERQMLRFTADGLSAAEIAARLNLSLGTVRNYLSASIQKTPLRGRRDAARYARKQGWL